jgi:hypothetical protein
VTAQATWQSSSTSVVTVNSSGVVSGIGAGDADVTATYQNVSGRMHVTLTRPAPSSFAVAGTVTDGTSGGVLPGISIGSSDGKSTTTGSTGKYSITGVAAGNITVTASASGYQTTSKAAIVSSDTQLDFVLARTSGPAPSPTPPGPAPSTPVGEPGLPSRTPSGTTFVCSLDAIVHPASCVNNSFGNATALCGDGARSCSSNNSGTCSSHDGVYCFVCPGALCPQ